MLPILLSLGPVKIYSYGVFLAIALFVSLYFWWKMGRDEHLDEIALFDGFFLSLITFFVAGRLGYVALHMGELGTLYRAIALLSYPGLNITVGIAASMAFMWLFARSNDWHVWKVADAYVVSLSILLTISGIGGLLNGSNPGRPASWGLMYPGQDTTRIPVDVWIIIWAVVTFAVVSRVRKNFRFYSWYKGESSTVAEGLASLVFVVAVGIYYVGVAWIDQVSWKVGALPGEFVVGMITIAVGLYYIDKRAGRRDARVWGKLKEVNNTFMQWLRK